MKRKILKTVAALLLSTFMLSVSASATTAAPYRGYTYDPYSNAKPAPIGYVPGEVYSSKDIGIPSLVGATDMYADGDELYIADTANNRIIVTDKTYRFLREYRSISTADGEIHELKAPQGISVEGESLIICNTGSAEVLLSDKEGRLISVYTAPEGEAIDEKYVFKPVRAVMDSSGYLYVRSDGDLHGLLCYDTEKSFIGYYGANKVKLSAGKMLDYFYKQILSREATDSMVRFVPAEVTAADIAPDGFLYVVTQAKNESDRSDRLRKLNALGDNILNSGNTSMIDNAGVYGDLRVAFTKGNTIDTRLVDICVDDDGYIAVLDQTYSRVFIYDQESNLITVFGAKGDQTGAVQTASAIELFGENYVVLDTARGVLVTYCPTEYIKLLTSADNLLMKGNYRDAYEIWQEVLTYDGANTLAFKGIGKALIEEEKFKEALPYLKRGQDRIGYSLAMQEYRKEFIRENWLYLTLAAVAVIAVLTVIIRLIFKKLGIKRKRNKIVFE